MTLQMELMTPPSSHLGLDLWSQGLSRMGAIYRLMCGNFVIMCTELQRFYIREVLDIYKLGTSSRYGSVDDTCTASGLSYLALRVYLPLMVSLVRMWTVCLRVSYPNSDSYFRTTAIKHLLYHLGPAAFVGDNCANLTLTAINAGLWLSLTQKAASEALKKLRIKIPGGKLSKK
jgi:hypothetical protein